MCLRAPNFVNANFSGSRGRNGKDSYQRESGQKRTFRITTGTVLSGYVGHSDPGERLLVAALMGPLGSRQLFLFVVNRLERCAHEQ